MSSKSIKSGLLSKVLVITPEIRVRLPASYKMEWQVFGSMTSSPWFENILEHKLFPNVPEGTNKALSKPRI